MMPSPARTRSSRRPAASQRWSAISCNFLATKEIKGNRRKKHNSKETIIINGQFVKYFTRVMIKLIKLNGNWRAVHFEMHIIH